MSGGYFTSGNLDWLAEDVGAFRDSLVGKSPECFACHPVYRKDMEKFPDLNAIADDPEKMKARVLGELAIAHKLMQLAGKVLHAVDYYASGDTGPDNFLMELAEIRNGTAD